MNHKHKVQIKLEYLNMVEPIEAGKISDAFNLLFDEIASTIPEDGNRQDHEYSNLIKI